MSDCSKPDYEMYDAVLIAFTKYMKIELEANWKKGDRNLPNGWLSNQSNKSWISELYYHVGKLQSALMSNDLKRIAENCADIANLAMMTLDVKVDLLATRQKETGGSYLDPYKEVWETIEEKNES